MKRCLLLSCCFLFLSFSMQTENPNFTGLVTLLSGESNMIHVGLYHYSSYDRYTYFSQFSNPMYYTTCENGDFSLDVEPGRYTLAVSASGYLLMKKRIFIPDKETVLKATVSLAKRISEQKSSATIEGYDLLDEYNQLCEDVNKTMADIRPILYTIRESEPEVWASKYDTVMQAFESIEDKYQPELHQLLIEYHLGNLTYMHPVMYDILQIWQQGELEGPQIDKLVEGSTFHDFFTTQLNLINALDPQSYLLEGDFVSSVTFLGTLTQYVPKLIEKYNLNEDHFYHFIIDFVEQCPNKTLCTQVLYLSGSNYAREGEAEKAAYLINWLKQDYADEFYVGQGHADKVLASLKVKAGNPAPDFKVTTLEGNVISLSDFRGKYVFIDFWGSWCGPCIGEIPNNRKLANTIPKDKLKVIGLAYDEKDRLLNFLAENPLPYDNAMAPAEVIDTYGVTGYPTTFLIDPEGIICANDLRGENLTELVLNEMGLSTAELTDE